MRNDGSRPSEKIPACDDSMLALAPARRDSGKWFAGAIACICLGAGCSSNSGRIESYPIDATVVTTTTRVLSFPVPPQPAAPNSGTGLYMSELSQIQEYGNFTPAYGAWRFSGEGLGLPIVPRFDLMPDGYSARAWSLTRIQQFASFFSISDIHITDKEAPNQFIYLQQEDPMFSGANTSIYSPIMPYTTHVLDAAIQTVNALHKRKPFDFGISLGDAANSTSYNELRWYIDVIDGKVITPSSGAHLGASTVDYQRPYQAAGLDKSIPFFQAIGNHDHFFIGSFPVDADPSLGLREAYLGDAVWAVPDVLRVNPATLPILFDMENLEGSPRYYQGVLDGSSPTGAILHAGPLEKFASPPRIAADPDRRSLLKSQWIEEFFHTTSTPVGHGFALVDPGAPEGFACYSFVPNPDVPLKVIVLDATQSETDGSNDVHGHGFLDAYRWAWLQKELLAGQAANQLMIIAAHVPIAVTNIGTGMEWWDSAADPNATEQNAVTLTGLVAKLQDTPNLLMWIAGHRHFNTVKALPSPDPVGFPEKGFWQVETSSLRDYPQQFRTFEIYLNSDYSVSMVVTNVDPAVAEGTPAAKSRSMSVAAFQIVQTNLNLSNVNASAMNRGSSSEPNLVSIGTMDPTRPQVPLGCYGPDPDSKLNCNFNDYADSSIVYGSVPGVPYCASYNAALYKQLGPAMINVLKAKYPPTIPP